MKDEIIKKTKEHGNYTLVLDEVTDESNRSKLSLIAHFVESGEVHNLFLSLFELCRCDAESIFKTIEAFLIRENLEITNVRFSDMDGCSTMAGTYHGVWSYFEQYSRHLVYIRCYNHRLALSFTHLIPKYDDFVKFHSLLLNLYLLLKNSTVTRNIFEEVHNACGLNLLKLMKTVTTRWLSHRKALERVLGPYKVLFLFEKDRTGSKVIYWFILKNVRHACKKNSQLLKKRALKFQSVCISFGNTEISKLF